MEQITLPKDVLDKILQNDAEARELNSKVLIENTKTHRRVLLGGLFLLCVVFVMWIITPCDVEVDVDNDSEAKITSEVITDGREEEN